MYASFVLAISVLNMKYQYGDRARSVRLHILALIIATDERKRVHNIWYEDRWRPCLQIPVRNAFGVLKVMSMATVRIFAFISGESEVEILQKSLALS
jgi:hypothetical protein